eukprot:178872-Ditylum_brightwellii.AAC.1
MGEEVEPWSNSAHSTSLWAGPAGNMMKEVVDIVIGMVERLSSVDGKEFACGLVEAVVEFQTGFVDLQVELYLPHFLDDVTNGDLLFLRERIFCKFCDVSQVVYFGKIVLTDSSRSKYIILTLT